MAKIPNTKVLRDFLVNAGGYYVPNMRDLTNAFCRVIFLLISFKILIESIKWGKKAS